MTKEELQRKIESLGRYYRDICGIDYEEDMTPEQIVAEHNYVRQAIFHTLHTNTIPNWTEQQRWEFLNYHLWDEYYAGRYYIANPDRRYLR